MRDAERTNRRIALATVGIVLVTFAAPTSPYGSHLPLSERESLWTAALQVYRTGHLFTAGDRVRQAFGEESWSERHNREPIILVATRDSGSPAYSPAWLHSLRERDVLDGLCYAFDPQECPDTIAATFIQFLDSELLDYATVHLTVQETGIDPARCREEDDFVQWAFLGRKFEFTRARSGWDFAGEEVSVIGEGWCALPDSLEGTRSRVRR